MGGVHACRIIVSSLMKSNDAARIRNFIGMISPSRAPHPPSTSQRTLPLCQISQVLNVRDNLGDIWPDSGVSLSTIG